MSVFPICPKCLAASGDDWSQCQGSCPVHSSPHFDQEKYGLIEHFRLVDEAEHARLRVERERELNTEATAWPPQWEGEEVPF